MSHQLHVVDPETCNGDGICVDVCPENVLELVDGTAATVEERAEECIMCGLCIRMCDEQMDARAIGFQNRGYKRKISTPFDAKSKFCRECGGCIYICPACQLRCTYTEPEKAICGGCANLSPPCVDKDRFDDMMCYMKPCVACEIQEDS